MSTTRVVGRDRDERGQDELIEQAAQLAAVDDSMRRAIIQARLDAGLSQRDVAELLGVKQSTISSFERQENDPHLSTIRRYALAVGAQIDHQVRTPHCVTVTSDWQRVPVSTPFDPPTIQPRFLQFAAITPSEGGRADFALIA